MSRLPRTVALAILVVMACTSCEGVPADADGGADGGAEGDASLGARVAINELMPSNQASNADENGEFDDWVELFNGTDGEVSLAGYVISDSDDLADPSRTVLTGDLSIPAGGVLLLWADRDPEQGAAHLPFALNAGAESVVLIDPEGTLVDRFDWSLAVTDQVFARFPDGSGDFERCDRPTPGALNGSSCREAR